MDEIELLPRGEIYIRIFSYINVGENPILSKQHTYRLLAIDEQENNVPAVDIHSIGSTVPFQISRIVWIPDDFS